MQVSLQLKRCNSRKVSIRPPPSRLIGGVYRKGFWGCRSFAVGVIKRAVENSFGVVDEKAVDCLLSVALPWFIEPSCARGRCPTHHRRSIYYPVYVVGSFRTAQDSPSPRPSSWYLQVWCPSLAASSPCGTGHEQCWVFLQNTKVRRSGTFQKNAAQSARSFGVPGMEMSRHEPGAGSGSLRVLWFFVILVRNYVWRFSCHFWKTLKYQLGHIGGDDLRSI